MEPPTADAIEAMGRLTAWLAAVYKIDLNAGPTITFISRGSNRWPAGSLVTTDPIAGHRDMSQTACPGDGAYPLVRGEILDKAKAFAGVSLGSSTTTAAAAPSTSEASFWASESTTMADPYPDTATTPTTTSTSTTIPTGILEHTADSSGEARNGNVTPLVVAGSALTAGAGALVLRSRRAKRLKGIRTEQADGDDTNS